MRDEGPVGIAAKGGFIVIAAIVPQFFTDNMTATLAYYDGQLGFETQFQYGDPVFYGGAIRDGLSLFFRHVDQIPPVTPNKYRDEFLDAYIRVTDIHGLYAEYSKTDVLISRRIGSRPWGFTEFVVRDIDGRLLCFGQATE